MVCVTTVTVGSIVNAVIWNMMITSITRTTTTGIIINESSS